MGVHPPFLFDGDPGAVAVRSDLDAGFTMVAVRDRWGPALMHRVSTVLRKCFSEFPRGVIVDLAELDDAGAHSVPVWANAHRRGADLEPAVPVALSVAAGSTLGGRLIGGAAGRYLPVFDGIEDARAALARRLPLTERLSLRIDPDVRLPGRARRLVRDACAAWGLADLEFPAQLVTSELVSNVVEHTAGAGRLLVARRGDGLHLAVADRSPVFPRPRGRVPHLHEGGRGLQIVHRLSAAWGAMPIEGGKVVWATVRPSS